jgi:mono/diheme cytochrome c family protein
MRNALLALAIIVAAGAVWWFTIRDDGSETAGGQPIVEVKVPALQGAAADGAQLFAANCAQCHGENASGRNGFGPPLVHVIYEPNHHGDLAFQMAVKQGVRAHHWPFGNMAPVPGVGEDDVNKIIAYVRTLQQANGIN